MKRTVVVCSSLDKKTHKRFRDEDLRQSVSGSLGKGRVFQYEGEIWQVVGRDVPCPDQPTSVFLGGKTPERPLSDIKFGGK